MLRHRLITGTILIASLLALIILDDRLDGAAIPESLGWLFVGRETLPRGLVLFLLGLVVMPLAGLELSRIVARNGIATRPWLTSLAATIGLVLSYAVPASLDAISAVAIVSTGTVLVFVASILVFSRHRNVQGVLAAAGAVVFALVYLGLMLGFLLALRREHATWWVVGVVFVTKACDTGAYFTGRAIGRHKMIPWLSPGKTWEGLAGGVLFAALIGGLLAAASGAWLDAANRVPIGLGVVAGVLFALVGQAGDLTMSLFKRGAGIKDSSSILPGLGGVLDVLDSPLMVAPVAYWLLVLGT